MVPQLGVLGQSLCELAVVAGRAPFPGLFRVGLFPYVLFFSCFDVFCCLFCHCIGTLVLFCLSAVAYAPAAAGCSNRTVTWPLVVDRRHLLLIFEEHSQHGLQISRFLKKTYLCARASVCAMPLQNLSHASIRPSYVLTFMLGRARRGLSDSHNTTACAACD